MGMFLQAKEPVRTERLHAGGQEPSTDAQSGAMPILLAGAQARGMADMLEMLELGAVLIGSSGQLLFASDRARALLRGHVCFAGGRATAVSQPARQALAELMHEGCGGGRAMLPPSDGWKGHATIVLRRLSAPEGPPDAPRLLDSILVVEPFSAH